MRIARSQLLLVILFFQTAMFSAAISVRLDLFITVAEANPMLPPASPAIVWIIRKQPGFATAGKMLSRTIFVLEKAYYRQ